MNILEEIAVKTRERIAQEKRQVPQEVLLEKIKERESLEQSGEKKRPVRTFLEALQKPGMSYICEVKKASPSKGLHRAGLPVHCNRKGVRRLRCFRNFLPDRAVLVFRIRPVSGSDHR